jgi:hypothetical protein
MTSGYSYPRVTVIRIELMTQHVCTQATFRVDPTELYRVTAHEKNGSHPDPQHTG